MNDYTRGVTTCTNHGERMPCAKCARLYKQMHANGELARITQEVLAEMSSQNNE